MHAAFIDLAAMAPLLADVATALSLPHWTRGVSGHTAIQGPLPQAGYYISFGPRPYYIVNDMTNGPLKHKLASCENGPFEISDFTIGHRGGGTLQLVENRENLQVDGKLLA